jgi:serine protease
MHAADIIFRGGLAATLVAAMSACAAGPVDQGTPPAGAESGVAAGMARIGDLPGDGQYQRFIVKYRPASEPGRNSAAVQQRLDAVASATAGFASGPIRLEWQRRLAVDADVFKASRPLDRDEAAALMAQFARDPQVEYIEVDGVVTIRQGVDVPPVKPLGDG